MLTLKQYLEEKNITLLQFSLISKVSYPTLRRIIKGEKISRKEIAKKISRLTKGEISEDSIYKKRRYVAE